MLRVSGLTARESLVVHLQLGTPWGSAQDRAVNGEKEHNGHMELERRT